MKSLRAVWRYLLAEPFMWIGLCILQPARFQREFNKEQSVKHIKLVLRLALPTFLITYPLVLVINAFLLISHVFVFTDALYFLLLPIFGVTLGVAGGFVLGFVSEFLFFALRAEGRIAFEFAVGSAGGFAVGSAWASTGASTEYFVLGVTLGFVLGVMLGVTDVLTLGKEGGLLFEFATGIATGISGGIAAGFLQQSAALGIATSTTFLVSYFALLYRLPLYPVNSFSLVKAYLTSKKNPPEIYRYLHRSALYWDEMVYLPLPYLKRILRIAAREDREQALREIHFIAAERPLQRQAAQAVALEITMEDLATRRSLRDIIGVGARLDEIFPPDAKLLNPQWVTPFARLRDASQEAQRSLSPLGRQARYKALEDMKVSLHKVHPNVAFSDQHLNRCLNEIVENWRQLAEQEQARLKQGQHDRGHIDNPYKPGQVLKMEDATFVGRVGLARQLEEALSRNDNLPTFMLYGERRIGKSSTLLHLSRLLGARYLPIFYDLQKTGITANIAIFLGSVAEEIYKVLSAKGMHIKTLSYAALKNARLENEAAVYHLFNTWLDEVERLLAADDRTLLLTLDEFEQLAEAERGGSLQLSALLNWFRNVIQYRERVALLFSGVHTLDEMEALSSLNWSSYFVNVRMLHVSFLRVEEAQELMACANEQIFSPEVRTKIIHVTGCHPFLIQALCSALIDYLNAEQRECATLEDVQIATEQVLADWSSYFSDLWRRTDTAQRTCLELLSCSSEAGIAQFAQDGLDERTIRRTLQTLEKRDLVLYDKDANLYRLAAPIFQAWVKSSLDNA